MNGRRAPYQTPSQPATLSAQEAVDAARAAFAPCALWCLLARCAWRGRDAADAAGMNPRIATVRAVAALATGAVELVVAAPLVVSEPFAAAAEVAVTGLLVDAALAGAPEVAGAALELPEGVLVLVGAGAGLPLAVPELAGAEPEFGGAEPELEGAEPEPGLWELGGVEWPDPSAPLVALDPEPLEPVELVEEPAGLEPAPCGIVGELGGGVELLEFTGRVFCGTPPPLWPLSLTGAPPLWLPVRPAVVGSVVVPVGAFTGREAIG
jgi:hypothetical protein